MTKDMRSRHGAASVQAARPRTINSEQDNAPTLPRTSRFRAHDHEGDHVQGCLGASARHEAGTSDVGEDRGILS